MEMSDNGKGVKFDSKQHMEMKMSQLGCGGSKYEKGTNAKQSAQSAKALADYAKKNRPKH